RLSRRAARRRFRARFRRVSEREPRASARRQRARPLGPIHNLRPTQAARAPVRNRRLDYWKRAPRRKIARSSALRRRRGEFCEEGLSFGQAAESTRSGFEGKPESAGRAVNPLYDRSLKRGVQPRMVTLNFADPKSRVTRRRALTFDGP